MAPERLADIGEFGLLARLRGRLGSSYLGDDAAVLPTAPDRRLLATVDAQVDGIHFLRDRLPARSIGRRAIAVNVSDIAAMGGEPRFALLSLLLPAQTEVAWIEALYDGIVEEASRWGVAVAGGNISSTPGPLVIDVTLIGDVEPSCILTRAGARPGDALLVTGSLGRAAAGLLLLQRGEGGALVDVYAHPAPRLREGRVLARLGVVHAALDLSDGLASDLHRLAEESRVGAVIDADALPISPEVRGVASRLGLDALALALHGGEDFELLIAAPTEQTPTISAALLDVGTRVSVIGEVRPMEDGVLLRIADGTRRPLAGGWNHFGDERGVKWR